jgi:hypothetical protein
MLCSSLLILKSAQILTIFLRGIEPICPIACVGYSCFLFLSFFLDLLLLPFPSLFLPIVHSLMLSQTFSLPLPPLPFFYLLHASFSLPLSSIFFSILYYFLFLPSSCSFSFLLSPVLVFFFFPYRLNPSSSSSSFCNKKQI